MDGLIPWQRLEQRIRPVYAKPGKGRRPYPLPVMLRIHCVQLFYNLSDPGMEHPFLKVKRVFGYAKSLPSRKRGCATGDWRRTRSVWRCYLAWATC